MSILHLGRLQVAASTPVTGLGEGSAGTAMGATETTEGAIAGGAAETATTTGRLYYLDWIRVVVIGCVFLGHTMMVFSGLPWLISSDQTIFLFVAPVLAIGNQVAMPLLFLVSGASTWFSLRKRTGKRFAQERFYRLVIPYLVFAVLLSPIQSYYSALDHGTYQGGFLAYLPHFFNLEGFGNSDLTWAGAYGYHLWFLIFLFFYSIVSLPLFLYLRRGKARWLPDFLVRICRRPGGILLFVAPIALSQILLRPTFSTYQSWADTFFWGFFYVYGYLFFADARLSAALDRRAWRSGWVGFAASGGLLLGLGLVTAVAIARIYSFTALHDIPPGAGQLLGTSMRVPAATINSLALTLISSNAWAGVLFAMALFKRFANQNSPALQYLGEIAMPFYLIHHPVIVIFGYYVIRLPLGVWAQMLLLFASAGVITWGIIELFIRRIEFLRVMLGMKPVPPGIAFNPRRSAPWQIGFVIVLIAYAWLLKGLGA